MMEKETSPTTSQRSASMDDHQKHEFAEIPECGDQRQSQKKSWLQRLNPFLAGEVPPVPLEDAGLVPDLQANFWSKLTWGWMGPLMMIGYKRPLQKEDLWHYDESRRTRYLADKLTENIEKRRKSGKSKHILLSALNDTFFWQFWTGGLLKLLGDCTNATSPLVMKALISYANQAYEAHLTGAPGPDIGRGIGLAVALAGMQTVQSICQHHFFYRSMMTGAMARSALISVIYRKSLVLSNKARIEFTNGKITNLMSTDVSRVDFAAGYCHIGWVAGIQVCIILAILIVNIGPSALAGFGLLILSAPVIGRIIRKLVRRRFKSTKFTDARVRITQEILNSMRVIKYYAWEKSFLAKVLDLRESELKIVRFLLLVRAGVNAVSMTIPVYASIIAFVTYSLTGHGLNPANIFSSLTLFNLLRMPLMFLPIVFAACTDAWVSLGRMQSMLLATELEDAVSIDPNAEFAIVVEKGRFVWEIEAKKDKTEKKEKRKWWQRKKSPPADSQTNAIDEIETESDDEVEEDAEPANDGPNNARLNTDFSTLQVEEHEQVVEIAESHAMDTSAFAGPPSPEAIDTVPISRTDSTPDPHHLQRLKDISFQIKRGEFIVIVGEIGSGKSSLLSALVGEMRRTEGVIKLGGTVGFCPQTAWIQNATVRNNILFGKEFDQEKYYRVIHDCALEADFEMLPNGDATEIGERGITVSGGQKARINIARAAYNDADIVLLDDPLSAVDAHVGRQLLDDCICGLMAEKTRILVTHQLHVLPRADRIFCMNQGKIVEQGTYDELISHGGDFSRLVEEYGGKEEEKKEEDEAEEDEIEESIDDGKERKPKQKENALMQIEERATGSVAWGVYAEYARAGGGIWVIPAIIICVLCCNGVNISTSLWLSYWTSNKYGLSEGTYVGIYAALGVSQAIFFFIFGYALTMTGNKASGNLHAKAINRVIRAPMSFFDTTPLGRIINRFSKDVDTMDNLLSDSYRMFLMTFTMIFATFVLIIAFFYWFALALGPLIIGFLIAAMFYRATAREVKRLDSILRSHVYAQFGETLTGLTTVRAYGKQAAFAKLNENYLDVMNRAYFMTIIDQRWLGIRLDFVGDILVFVVAILVVTSRFSVSPSISGLVLSYCVQIVAVMGWMVRQFAEVENNMNATERVHHYATVIDTEAPLDIPDRKPKDSWPDKGEVVMKDVVLRYREGLPAVLKNLNLNIQGGERIGIVGRTGAGKSSIMVALFRIVELSGGSITIDGVDISQIGLHDLRSALAIIPQDPVLFQGTIRSNLDPFNQYDDVHLWESLRRAHLVEGDLVSSTSSDSQVQNLSRFNLDQNVDDEGLNFSLGQRQLLAMARALVRKARIIIMDEATSSVDFETDAKIQTTIKREFKGATLLTIAHRLRSIINYDRIAVMSDGVAVEFDTPLKLYDNPNGVFYSLCQRSGINREDIVNAAEYV